MLRLIIMEGIKINAYFHDHISLLLVQVLHSLIFEDNSNLNEN